MVFRVLLSGGATAIKIHHPKTQYATTYGVVHFMRRSG
jgi:hypothetical protein